MAIKELQTRIALKYDSYENWKDSELVLLPGEIGLCEIPGTTKTVVDQDGKSVQVTTAPTVLFKVGNKDKTPFKELPWASAKAADVHGWAKAATVEVSKIEGKEYLVFKDAAGVEIADARVDLSRFALATDVKSTTDDLAARISAVEGVVGGSGMVADHESRLDVIEGADTVDGSIAKALKDAKEYADGLAVNYDADGSAATAEANAKAYAKEYADGKDTAIQAAKDAGDNAAAALTAYKTEMDTALAGKQDVIPENTYDAHGAATQALEDAKAYTDEREVEINKYADQAEADAKAYTDTKVEAQATKDAAQDAALAEETGAREALAVRVKALEDIDNATQAELDAYKEVVTGAIATARGEAIAAAKIETETQVNALANGAVAANTQGVADNAAAISAMDAAYKTAVADEAKAREDADVALDARLDKVEAFFEGAAEDSEGLNNALDKLVDIQNYLAGEGSGADGLMGQVSANTQAIEGLSGRMDTAEDDIEALEAKDTELANADTALGQRIDDVITAYAEADTATLNAAKEDATKKADDALAAAKSDATTKANNAQAAAEETAANALSSAVETLNASIAAKVATSDFNNYKTEVSTTYETKTVVSGIDSRLTTAEGTINAQGETIASKLDASAFDTFKTGTYDVAVKALQDKDAELAADIAENATAITNITKADGAIATAVKALEEGKVQDNADAIAELEETIAALDDTYVSETEFTAFKNANTEAISGVNTTATNAGAAASAVASRVDAYDTYFGVVDGVFPTTLIFNCGSATEVIEQ